MEQALRLIHKNDVVAQKQHLEQVRQSGRFSKWDALQAVDDAAEGRAELISSPREV